MVNNEATGTDPVDGELLALMRDALPAVRMQRPVERVAARGRSMRRRRRTLAGAAAVAVVAAGLAIGLPHSAAGSGGAAQLSADGQTVNVDNAAWSVHTEAHATVALTVRQLGTDPQKLRAVLAKAGVRAIVLTGPAAAHCSFGGGITSLPQINQVVVTPTVLRDPGGANFVIHPDAMPPGSVLSVMSYDVAAVPNQTGAHTASGSSAYTNVVAVALLSGYPRNCG